MARFLFPALITELLDCVLLMVVGTQDAALLYFLHYRFPRIRTSDHPTDIHSLQLGVKVVKRQHIWVCDFTAFPDAFLRLHVLKKEFAVSDSSLPVTRGVNSFMGEVIVSVVSLLIKGHRCEG